MKLIPKRKLVLGDNTKNVEMQHITNNIIDDWGDFPVKIPRLWVTYRLRIPVGTDMYD